MLLDTSQLTHPTSAVGNNALEHNYIQPSGFALVLLYVAIVLVHYIPYNTCRGVLTIKYTTTGSVNGERFVNFFLSVCASNYENPRSIVVMDNASIYHLDKVHELKQSYAFRPHTALTLCPSEVYYFPKLSIFLKPVTMPIYQAWCTYHWVPLESINFSVCKDAGTIWGQEQYQGGFN